MLVSTRLLRNSDTHSMGALLFFGYTPYIQHAAHGIIAWKNTRANSANQREFEGGNDFLR